MEKNDSHTNEKTAHTPLPWKVGKIYTVRGKQHVPILCDNFKSIAATTPVINIATEEDSANAAFIVKACNSYPELVRLLSKAKTKLSIQQIEPELIVEIEQALKNAESL